MIIMTELGDVAKKYGSPRKTEILYDLPDDLQPMSRTRSRITGHGVLYAGKATSKKLPRRACACLASRS